MIQSHIGQIIMSTTLDTEAKVKELYGGVTWVRIQDKVLMGASNSKATKSTGGAETHNHSVSISLSLSAPTANTSNDSYNPYYQPRVTSVSGSGSGSTGTASNLPPYYACYIWHRTA